MDLRPRAWGVGLRTCAGATATQKAADWEISARATLARALLEQGRAGDALTAVDAVASLAARSQSPQVRLAVAEVRARIHAASGRADDAVAALDAALAEANRLRLLGPQLEIRLARGEIGMAAGQDRSVSELQSLATYAGTRGFGLVARRAEAAVRKRRTAGGDA